VNRLLQKFTSLDGFQRQAIKVNCVFLLLMLLHQAQVLQADTEVFFSPKGGCEQKVVQLIDGTKSKVDAAIYSLNNIAILKALQRAKLRGVTIRILLDRIQAGGKGNRTITLGLKKDGFDVRLHSKSRIQHNKFAVFDGARVVTGSFNWTNPAEQSNEENCLFLDDATIIEAYQKRFIDHLWVVNTEAKSRELFKRLETPTQ
jgi:phosphatidylserine/phosphatidylglycerophosphate/cardiolipin synthase-like enzyme